MNAIVEREKYGARGEGSLIRREGCANWLYQYFFGGKLHEESTGTADFKKAKKFAKDRREKIGADRQGLKKFLPASQTKATVGELLDALEADYRIRERKAIAQALSHMKPIRERFGALRAAEVTGRLVDSYIDERLAAGDPNATINRRTQLLSQAFRREIKQDQPRVLTMPTIRRLPEKNTRQGFFEPAEFAAVCAGLPEALQDFARFIYLTAWRPGDLKALTWSMVDMKAGTIRLPDSKNGKGKALAIVGDLVPIMARRYQARLLETKDGNVRVVDHVFHRAGRPISDYRDAWFRACKAAGFTYTDPTTVDPQTGKPREYVSKLLYDCKRSAIRNLVRNGVPERVALDVAGIKTRAILDRYNISSDRDKRAALEAVSLPVA